MFASMAQSLILLPIAGFALAAGIGVMVRSRRAREDKNGREAFTING
jgi:LPXTG-motif cell wall-anchored protein